MTVSILIPGRALPFNHAWKRGPRGIYKTKAAKAYQESVAAHALAMRMKLEPQWPLNCASYRVDIICTNPHPLMDVDAPIKLILDALQGILFTNDRAVCEVRTAKRFDETTEPSVLIVAFSRPSAENRGECSP